MMAAQGCMILMVFLKQHLKDMYGITDGRISRYSPSEPKIYEKAINRKSIPDFQPKSTIDVIKKSSSGLMDSELTEVEKHDLIDKYLDFKQLMLKLDPDDADSQDEDTNKSKMNNSMLITPKTPNTTATSIDISYKDDNNRDTTTTSSSTTPHMNNINNSVSTSFVTNKDLTSTPTTRNLKSSSAGSQRNKRQSNAGAKGRKKKRKLMSSDNEDSDFSK